MKHLVLLITVVFLGTNLFAQVQPTHLIQEAAHKAELFNQQKLNELVMTDNQSQYDVTHYWIEGENDFVRKSFDHMVKITSKVIGSSIAKMELNFINYLKVDSVFSNSVRTTFSHHNDILTVNLDQSYLTNSEFIVTVYYSGILIYAYDEYNGKPLSASLNQPYNARWWLPCKDFPEDKADSVDIITTVPESIVLVSNGLLYDKKTENGKTTFWWKERHPIATYLISAASYEYSKYTDWYVSTKGDSLPIEFYVAPDHLENSKENFYKVKDMIAIFSELFGEYPFMDEKYGHAEFIAPFGMEHQTITSMGPIKTSNGIYSIKLIVHELAHQWWGDMITCESYNHIWLNEGFATYSEALYFEVLEGEESYKNAISKFEYYGSGSIYVSDAIGGEIFNLGRSYHKGAYVLHMLRHVLGDEVFFNVLKAYGNNPDIKYGTATTEEFKAVCESISGMDLSKFFQQWIYGEYFPVYNWEYTVDNLGEGNGFRINLDIEQTQDNTDLFTMPIDILVTTAVGEQTFVVQNSLKSEHYEIIVADDPTLVELDPDNWILKKTDGPTGIKDEEILAIPTEYNLSQNYPNPFNPTTTIKYSIPERQNVGTFISLSVFDILGNKVATLVNEQQKPGNYEVNFDASNLPSGVYFYKIQAGNFVETKKMILLR